MLGTVVAEHAPYILHQADKPDVDDEDRDAHDAIEDVPGNRVHALLAQHEIAQRRGQDDEDDDAEYDADNHRNGHEGARAARLLVGVKLVRVVGFFLVPLIRMLARYAKRLVAECERFDERRATPDDGPVHPRVLLAAGCKVVFLCVDAAIGRAHGNRPVVATAHHDALDEGLSADMRPRPDVRIGLECLA